MELTIFQHVVWNPSRSLPLLLLGRCSETSDSKSYSCESLEAHHLDCRYLKIEVVEEELEGEEDRSYLIAFPYRAAVYIFYTAK